MKEPEIHLGEMGEAQCGGHGALENFTSKESISLYYLLITNERMHFFLKSTGRYLTICFCIYLNKGDNIFFKKNSFSEIKFFLVFIFFFSRQGSFCSHDICIPQSKIQAGF